MIKVNCRDGKTISFDLNEESEREELIDKLSERDFLRSITGVSSLHNTFWHVLTRPKKFRKVSYFVELVKHKKNGVEKIVGEKIICQADDVQLSILVYYNVRPKITRIELKKIGKQRFIATRNEVKNGSDFKKDN